MYNKLFSSITSSTIWRRPSDTKVVWITMLAMADKDGSVITSIPGLAHIAGVSLEVCLAALKEFQEPDEYSRTKDYEGRRIAEIDGGFFLLNHAKYNAIRSENDRQEQNRQAQARFRAKHVNSKQKRNNSKQNKPPSAPTDVALDIDSKATTLSDKSLGEKSLFEQFWAIYPVKKGRKAAEAKWRARHLDVKAEEIMADVRRRMTQDGDWVRGYVPHGSSYVNGEGWTDGLKPLKNGSAQGDTFGGAI